MQATGMDNIDSLVADASWEAKSGPLVTLAGEPSLLPGLCALAASAMMRERNCPIWAAIRPNPVACLWVPIVSSDNHPALTGTKWKARQV